MTTTKVNFGGMSRVSLQFHFVYQVLTLLKRLYHGVIHGSIKV